VRIRLGSHPRRGVRGSLMRQTAPPTVTRAWADCDSLAGTPGAPTRRQSGDHGLGSGRTSGRPCGSPADEPGRVRGSPSVTRQRRSSAHRRASNGGIAREPFPDSGTTPVGQRSPRVRPVSRRAGFSFSPIFLACSPINSAFGPSGYVAPAAPREPDPRRWVLTASRRHECCTDTTSTQERGPRRVPH
jgi:hypothetical protein